MSLRRAAAWGLVLGAPLLGCGGKGGAAAARDAGSDSTDEAPAPQQPTSAPSSTAAAEPERAARPSREAAATAAPPGEHVVESDQPVALAIAGGTVTWADAQDGVIASAALDGGARQKPHVLAKGLSFSPRTSARSIAVDAEQVYWLSGVERKGKRHNAVFRVAAQGGSLYELTTTRAASSDIALGEDSVYWLDRDAEGGPAAVMVVSKEGGAARELVRMAAGCALAVDSTGIYWIEQGEKPSVRRADLATGDVKTLAPANGASCALTLDERSVSWLRARGDEVLAVDKAGGGARVVARVPKRVTSIAAGPGGLFVAAESFPDGDRLEAVVWRIGAGEPVAVARGGKNPRLCVSGSLVAWSIYDDGGGSVLVAPRVAP